MKERLFGLTGPEGNHGEDVKELYFYLDASPSHSYARALYHYPRTPFPYQKLRQENRARSRLEPELDLEELDLFENSPPLELEVEYAKPDPESVVLRYRLKNPGDDPQAALLMLQFWARNTWSWGRSGPDYPPRPRIHLSGTQPQRVEVEHPQLGPRQLTVFGPGGSWLFTENESRRQELWGVPDPSPYRRDSFHRYWIQGETDVVHPDGVGSKVAFARDQTLGPQESVEILAAFSPLGSPELSQVAAEEALAQARKECLEFTREHFPPGLTPEEETVIRQAYAGLLWTKQVYRFRVDHWLEGDPAHPKPPGSRRQGRNHDWPHLDARDVLSMPDKWEYPWFAAWDLAFHLIPLSRLDPEFAKSQLLLLLSDRYMHPNGQVPAYEFQFSDSNPPVLAWAAAKMHRILTSRGTPDLDFLERAFHRLLIHFTYWVNRKDPEENHLFSGGFLGLDNIGVFDRSKPFPGGGILEQADGTAWMAFFAAKMLEIALTLARTRPAYESAAAKFYEHFLRIAHAMNHFAGFGLWSEDVGFYHDVLRFRDHRIPLKVRSVVGLIPLFAVDLLPSSLFYDHPEFAETVLRIDRQHPELSKSVYFSPRQGPTSSGEPERLLALVSPERLVRILKRVLDEQEFLSDFGVRSLSRHHLEHPFEFPMGDQVHKVRYVSGESETGLFGGNSNWRGPIWMPLNYLLLDALDRYHDFFGESLEVECPTGSGNFQNLSEVSVEVATRLGNLFRADAQGRRPWHGTKSLFWKDPRYRDLHFFPEYFDGDSGRGLGASHQTGWTSLITRFLKKPLRARSEPKAKQKS